MRLMPDRYIQPKPAQIKRSVVSIKYLVAPLKGLSLSSKPVAGDPLTASILDNWVVEENGIRCRPGHRKVYDHSAAQPIWCLVPFYGQNQKLAAATNHELRLLDDDDDLPDPVKPDGTLLKDGFTSDDWHWTSFSNLSSTDFTVMVNGADGVWSWTGGATQPGTPIPVLSITKANPAMVTVAPLDIGHFYPGMNVTIAGATGDFAVANGNRVIGSILGSGFTLLGVDTSAATGTSNAGITAVPQGSVVKENVTAPASAPHIVPDQFNVVISHMNRLWFADSTNLAVYYLPLQQKSGEVKELPLNAIFKRGGNIRAMHTWTVDGGMGLDDQIVFFSSNGECAIYGGTDPDTDMTLVGVYHFDAPLSKHSVVNYGGDLYVLISTGLVPMSTLIRAETEQLGQYDKNVYSEFFKQSLLYRDRPGWSAMLNHTSGRIYCNLPLGSPNGYRQLVRFMPNPVWASWSRLPARCWGWINNQVFFGSDDGKVYEMHPSILNDEGRPIRADVQWAWSNFGTPALKHFKMVKPYMVSDGLPKPNVDFKVDNDMSPPVNQPDVTTFDSGAEWNEAEWELPPGVYPPKPEGMPGGDYWAQARQSTRSHWSGVGVMGVNGAPRITALITNCEFAIAGVSVGWEPGAPIP